MPYSVRTNTGPSAVGVLFRSAADALAKLREYRAEGIKTAAVRNLTTGNWHDEESLKDLIAAEAKGPTS